jgi:alpha-mannosidase
LPAAQSFVNIEETRGAVSLSSFALRPAIGKNGAKSMTHVLRLYEVSGEEALGKVAFPYDIKSAHYVDLRGNYQSDATFSENTVDYAIHPYGIASIALEM